MVIQRVTIVLELTDFLTQSQNNSLSLEVFGVILKAGYACIVCVTSDYMCQLQLLLNDKCEEQFFQIS